MSNARRVAGLVSGRRGWFWTVAVTAILIAALAFTVDLRKLASLLARLNAVDIGVAMLLIAAVQVALAARWAAIASRLYGLSTRRAAEDAIAGTMFSLLTPAGVGGDIFRVAVSGSGHVQHVAIGVTVILERVMGLLAYVLSFFLCLIFAAGGGDGSLIMRSKAPMLAFGGLLTLGLVFSVRFLPGLIARLLPAYVERLRAVEATLKNSWSLWAVAASITVISTFGWIASAAWLARAMGVEIGFASVGAVTTVAELIRLLPITVQGAGVREAAFGAGFLDFGATMDEGVAVGATLYLLQMAVVLVMGLPAWWLRRTRSAASANRSENRT